MNLIRTALICLLMAGLSLGCNTDKKSGAGGAGGAAGVAYDACEGLECGASCDPCVPGEACSGEEIATQCNADGQCVPAPTVQCEVSDLCEGVMCPSGETFCEGDILYSNGASACNPETGMCEPVLGPEPRDCGKEALMCDFITDDRGRSTGVYDCVDCGAYGCPDWECNDNGLTCGESCGSCDSDDPSCLNPEVERFCTLWGACRVHAPVCAPDAVEITACAGPAAATASFSHIWRTEMPLIQGDYMHLRVHQTGVCADDEFVACHGDFMQTTQDETPFIEPMRVALSLNLATDREDCDEAIVRDVFIDLAGLRETYRQQHPNGAHFFYVVLPDGRGTIALPAASTPDMVSPREPVGGVPSVGATVRVYNQDTYRLIAGVTVTRDGHSATTNSHGGGAILSFPKGPYRLRLDAGAAADWEIGASRPHTVWGVASNFSFEHNAYMNSEMRLESLYSSLGLIDDPTRGILVVRPQASGANVSIDAEHGPAFVVTSTGPILTQTIPMDDGSTVTFPNVAPGLVNIETTFPQGRCRIFPAETNDRTVEVVAGEVTLVDFVCRLDP